MQKIAKTTQRITLANRHICANPVATPRIFGESHHSRRQNDIHCESF
jgi:hypothetical protein